jgi:hypothetical protein
VTLAALSPREASIFACLCDTVVAPGRGLPPVTATDAVEFFDFWVEHSPLLNRVGIKALLYATELAPRLLGFGGRLRALSEADRARALEKVEHTGTPQLRQLAKLLKGLAFLSYYGDDGIMRRLGYDADERVSTGRRLRAAEGRP